MAFDCILKLGVLENSGIAAKIPVVVREASHSFLNLGPDDYYDAVVILQKFANSINQVTLLKVNLTLFE